MSTTTGVLNMEALTDSDLAELRRLAQDLSNRSDWSGVLALAPRFRLDTAYWIDVWAPLLAVAARHVGDASARGYLDEAIAGGFSQPEILEGEVERCFGGEPDWPALAAALASNVPPAGLQLLAWPEFSLAHPVSLAEIAADRRAPLRQRIPEPGTSAWATACQLLHWVTTAWDHSAWELPEWSDALHVLDRVAGGERFACTEYTIVLSQALNAVGIPARSVSLLRSGHHTGLGRVHDVTEAWIDDLRTWVVLDGQNGIYWIDDDGRPLGVPELWHRLHADAPQPDFVNLAGKSVNPELWWPHFFTVAPTGALISVAPLAPVLEATRVLRCDELRGDPAGTYPDLLELSIGITDLNGRPAIQPLTRHPHALGFEMVLGDQRCRLTRTGEAWPIPTEGSGEHTATISTITSYGAHGPHPLRYRSLLP